MWRTLTVKPVRTTIPTSARFHIVTVATPARYRGGMEQLDRITQKPDVMGGRACIRGMRVTVGMLVGQIGAGRTVEEVLADYPYLEREDIMQALRSLAG